MSVGRAGDRIGRIGFLRRSAECSWRGSFVLRNLVVAFVLLAGTQAAAQHAGDPGSAPPPPAGDGTLTVQVVHKDDPSKVEGVAIALYALAPNGSPGFAGGKTDAEGVYTFSGISTDPSIVYLLGARYAEIPFGERVNFEADQKQAFVRVEVSEPTDEVSGVGIEELRLRIDWMGDRVLVREILRLTSTGDRVIRLPDDASDRAIAVRKLGSAAESFSTGGRSVSDGLRFENGRVEFRGPLYPGDQRVEYQYSLPIPSEGKPLRIPVELADRAGRIVVVAGTSGLGVRGPQLIASSDVTDLGQTLKAWARAGLAANEVFLLDIDLPESRFDASALSVPRTDVWIEVDDTRLSASVDIQIKVEPGAPVAGTLDEPLLRVSLPPGSTLQGVAPEAEALGLVPQEDGGFDVIGPIGAGTTSLGYSYRLLVKPEGVKLDMRFPAPVETLNVLVADTGLALESSRLHRRRPFRSGTRNYLHRESYNVGANETVDLSLVPIGAEGIPRSASIGLTIAAAIAGALFLFAPLRTIGRNVSEDDSGDQRIAIEREAVYTAIHDLDHDFETGKLDEGDYNEMRAGLRHKAIELLRSADRAAKAPSEAVASASAADASQPQTGSFCPNCGGAVLAAWRFCSHCGGGLNPTSPAEESIG
jgi:hypothetical protein